MDFKVITRQSKVIENADTQTPEPGWGREKSPKVRMCSHRKSMVRIISEGQIL